MAALRANTRAIGRLQASTDRPVPRPPKQRVQTLPKECLIPKRSVVLIDEQAKHQVVRSLMPLDTNKVQNKILFRWISSGRAAFGGRPDGPNAAIGAGG